MREKVYTVFITAAVTRFWAAPTQQILQAELRITLCPTSYRADASLKGTLV